MALFTISGAFALIFQCTPARAAYDKTLLPDHAKCFNGETLFAINTYQGVIMLVVDLVIIVLPLPSIWKLQMPLRKRVMVIFMFCPGWFHLLMAVIYSFNLLIE